MTRHEGFDPKKTIDQLYTLIHKIEPIFNDNYEDVNYYDKEMQDLLHELELIKFNAFQGYSLAKKLKENRIHRRKAKDMNLALKPLYDFYMKNKDSFKELRSVQSEVTKIEANLKHRVYTPRVNNEMTEAFKKANEAKVE